METTKPATRPSRLVNLDQFEAIKLRMGLNQKLMAGTCAFSEPLDLTFSENEFQVLKVMAGERFSVNTVVRKRAIAALGRQKTVEVMDELVRLAETEHEESAVRYEALKAIGALSPRVGRVLMEKQLNAGSPELALSIVGYLYQTGEPEAKQQADRFLSLRKNARIRQAWDRRQKPNGRQAVPQPDRNLNGRLH
ncbi:HEAT repeat domain-containing protein [Larkinella arboricola]